MSIPCAVLMCHAPIVVPDVAGERAAQCSRTTNAMREVAERVAAHAPDVLVVISPHAARHANHWSVSRVAALHGSFARFGAGHVHVSLPGAPQAAERLVRNARALAVELAEVEHSELERDHGALVPLYFVQQAGFSGATLIVAPPARRTHMQERVGRAIAQAAAEAGQRWVVLASGDMSHRLIPGAPSGYDPRAAQFDDTFREHIERGALRAACTTDPALRELAAEDVVDSVAVAAAAVNYCSDGHRTLHYEGPFGVGYLEAVLFDATPSVHASAPQPAAAEPPWQELLALARVAIANGLSKAAAQPEPELPESWRAPCGVFVTLRRRDGSLRGCVGHITPTRKTLADEVAACAIAAATRDTRFRPVTLRELPALRIEISLLSSPELVNDRAMLDPERYGVVVTSGQARGVLLPNVEGVTTIADQLRIAASKGALPAEEPDQPWTIERFEVRKAAEELPLTTMRRGHA